MAILLLMVHSPLVAVAQEQSANHIHYSTDNGLSSNAVSDLVTDSKGFVWVATWNGLCRFDGYDFRQYATGPTSGIPYLHNRILDIYPDVNGNVWMRMYDNRIFVLNRHTDRLQSAFQGMDDAASKMSPRRLAVAPDGNVYAKIDGEGIWQFNLCRGVMRRRHIDTRQFQVRNILADSHGTLWLETVQGLVYMDTHTGEMQVVPGLEGDVISWMNISGESLYVSRKDGEIDRISIDNPMMYFKLATLKTDTPITSISIDRQGRIWFTTSQPGVSMYNPQSGVSSHYTQTVLSPENDIHGATVQDVDGNVWVRMFHGGFGRYNEEANTVDYFYNSPDHLWNLSNTVLSYLALPGGVMLLSTNRRGLDLIQSVNSPIERNWLVPGSSLYGVNETRALLWERSTRQLLVGNKCGDIYAGGRIIASTHGRIYHMMQDRRGLVWISDKDKGLFTLDMKTGKLNSIAGLHDVFKDNVYQTLEDSTGVVWVAHYRHGVVALKNGRQLNIEGMPKDSHFKVRTICQVPGGDIWAGSTDGIIIIKKKGSRYVASILQQTDRYQYQLPVNDIIQIRTDSHRRIWIATNGGGLARVISPDVSRGDDAEEGKYAFRTVSEANGLPSDEIRSITFDHQGLVWFTADQYICAYDPQREFITTYSTQDGVGDATCSEAAGVTLPDGRMVFGTFNGYYIVDKRLLASSRASGLRLAITDFFVDGKVVSPSNSDLYDYNVIDSGSVALPSRSSSFSLRFASLNLQLQHRVHYRYLLEGYDRQWHSADRSRMAIYSDVPSGTYKFRVRAFLMESPQHYDESVITITVPPYMLLSAPAIWTYVIIAIIGIAVWFGVTASIRRKRLSNMRLLKVAPDEVGFADNDDYDFVKHLLQWLEEHYGDSHLKIEDMAAVTGMSRTSFYNELKALTGMSPKEFVTDFRLKKACMYLSQNTRTIAEITYLTGFNDPVYFARIFRQKMGVSPSAWREKESQIKSESNTQSKTNQ